MTCDAENKEWTYTKLTGCPVVSRCDAGLNGNWFIDTGFAAMGGLDTTVDNFYRLPNFNATTLKVDPTKFPCAISIYNFPHKELVF